VHAVQQTETHAHSALKNDCFSDLDINRHEAEFPNSAPELGIAQRGGE